LRLDTIITLSHAITTEIIQIPIKQEMLSHVLSNKAHHSQRCN